MKKLTALLLSLELVLSPAARGSIRNVLDRFYGMTYGGMATNNAEAASLGKAVS